MANYSASDGWFSRGRHRDLDWGLPSSLAIRTYRKQHQDDSWQCGDSRKARQVVCQFSKNSSMHGVRHICGARGANTSCLKRLFYSVSFIACVVATLASVTVLVQESFRKESVYISSTSKDTIDTGLQEDHYFPEFPRILLCRNPPYKMSSNASEQKLLEYAYVSLGYPFPSLTPLEKSLVIGVHQHRMFNMTLPSNLLNFSKSLDETKDSYYRLKESAADFNLTHFIVENAATCDEVFIRCMEFVFVKNCCEIFRPVLTSLGICFSFTLERQMLQHFSKNDDFFQLIFDLYPAPQPKKAVEVGYEIHLLDPRNEDMTVNLDGGYALINGFITNVKTRLVKTSRLALYTAWHGLSYQCPTVPADLDPSGHGDRFFKHVCEKYYLAKLARDRCGCRFLRDTSNASMRQCDPEDIYGCFVGSALKDNLTEMTDICIHPCIEYNYKSEVNFFKIGENCSRLVFFYDGAHYSLQEYRKTTVSGFLSQIGGVLGLYLGASIITAAELLIFLASLLWYSIVPRRKRASTVSDSTRVFLKRSRKQDKEFCI